MTETRALDADIAPSDDLGAPARGLWQRFEPTALGAGSIVALLVVWELVPHLVTLSPGTNLFFTTPSQVAGTLWGMFATGTIWKPLGVSASGFSRNTAVKAPLSSSGARTSTERKVNPTDRAAISVSFHSTTFY